MITNRIKSFVAQRQAEGISNAEINQELSALKRAFNLGLQAQEIAHKPHIPTLREDNIRKGGFEHEEFIAVRTVLPEHLKPVATFAYLTGWRKEEVLSLTWRQVDRQAGIVRIDPGVTKGGEGRQIFLEGELRDLMEARWQERRLDCPYVFHHAGRLIKGFRRSWARAVRDTGLAGKLFHDLRRTAVRNMVRARVPERVAMAISGHQTRSVFDRYHIVSDADLKNAARQMDKHYRHRMVTKTVTVRRIPRRVAGEG